MYQMMKTDNGTIHYIVERKNIKNINLRITSEGKVIVSAHPFVSQDRIDEFIKSKQSWILQKLERVEMKNDREVITKDHIVLFGKRLKIKYIKCKKTIVTYDSQYLYVKCPENTIDRSIDVFLSQLCHDIFYDIAKLTLKKMDVLHMDMPLIKVRKMKRQWGNCRPQQKIITLNRTLIHYPVGFMEYVILHEFAHFMYPNHSKDFYGLIERYMPDYKERMQLAK